MSHTIEISDDLFERLRAVAQRRGQTVEAYLDFVAAQQLDFDTERDPVADPRYYTFDEFFTHLGMSAEDIQQAKQQAASDDADI